MGYTHYWKFNKGMKEDEAKKVLEEVKHLVSVLPEFSTTAGGYHTEDKIELGDGWGEKEPIFNEDEILFNGKAYNGLDHEGFHVDFKNPTGDFCKTARKPYDMLVCLCLISLKNNVKGFSFSSDGDLDDWKPAFEFYMEQGYKLKFDPDECLD